MRIGIMQPYVFPYLGYYQLVNTVDAFVFFDDVNYIKKGWINKNNILVNEGAYKFTLPVKDSSQNKRINEIELSGYKTWCDKFLKTLSSTYKKSPQFIPAFQLVSNVLEQPHELISEVAECSIKKIAEFLEFGTLFEKSSAISYNIDAESGEEKILDICRIKNASAYINPSNGRDLYSKERFVKNEIDLYFIRMNETSYMQFSKGKFVPSLSIIDILMFNDKETIKQLLQKFTLE